MFKFEVCTCISLRRASKLLHLTQTFKLFGNTSPKIQLDIGRFVLNMGIM